MKALGLLRFTGLGLLCVLSAWGCSKKESPVDSRIGEEPALAEGAKVKVKEETTLFRLPSPAVELYPELTKSVRSFRIRFFRHSI